jgi:DNA-binding response OmpR family regulator
MFLRSCDRHRTDEADQLKVLSAGADDYICKPFGLVQLVIRIEVVLRRMKPVTSSRIVFDRLAIDSARREATLNDRIIKQPGNLISCIF